MKVRKWQNFNYSISHVSFNFSDGWADRPDVVDGIENLALGGMSIKLHSPEIADFDDYFKSLSPLTNSHNPWFTEFWEEKFNCSVDTSSRLRNNTKICSGTVFHIWYTDTTSICKLQCLITCILCDVKL